MTWSNSTGNYATAASFFVRTSTETGTDLLATQEKEDKLCEEKIILEK